jgi:hypothetical protein
MNIENQCPVCGYEMEAPPTDYRICPSCGTEFGVHDVNASIAELREAWMGTGPRWWSNTDTQPANWDPLAQMESAGIVVKRQAASQSLYVSTSTATATVSWDSWGAAAQQQPGDRSLLTGSR